MDEQPDCKTPEEALAQMVQAINDVPVEALSIDTSFGRRHESAGGGWYWSVVWHLGAGTGAMSRSVNKPAAMQMALKQALDRIDELQRHGVS